MVDHLGAVGYPVGFLICALMKCRKGHTGNSLGASLPGKGGNEKVFVAAGRKNAGWVHSLVDLLRA